MSIIDYRATPTADACYRCGYDLRGIADDQPCPECGLLAGRSRRPTDELHNSRPRWLRNLSRGVWLILIAIVAPLLWLWLYTTFRAQLWSLYGPGMPPWQIELLDALPMLGYDLPAFLLLGGVLLLTTREGYEPADRADHKRRIWLRILAKFPLIGLLAEHFLMHRMSQQIFRNIAAIDRLGLWTFIVPVATLLACAPLPILLFAQLGSLANRARSAHLAEHCKIVGIGSAVAFVYLAAVIVIFEVADKYHFGTYWTGRSWVAMALQLLSATAAALILLWSFYLMLRFALAFRRAAKQLRTQWKRDDRAVI